MMHFEIFVEDLSGKKALDMLMPKIIKDKATYNVVNYREIGRRPKNYPTVVIVVCNLDNKCLKIFRQELLDLLNTCNPKPETRFCIAIEEGEAWLLGDIAAIKKSYLNANEKLLNGYQNDTICGTWELLADAIYDGGAKKLKSQPWNVIGKIKSEWAEQITPHINIDKNKSPSFCYFRDKIRELI